MKIQILCTLIALSFSLTAQARDCTRSAQRSVEGDMLSHTTRVVEEITEVVGDELIEVTVKLVKNSRDQQLRGQRRAQLISDIENQNENYNHYLVVTSRNQVFLSFTDAGSCAPYDPIYLGKIEE